MQKQVINESDKYKGTFFKWLFVSTNNWVACMFALFVWVSATIGVTVQYGYSNYTHIFGIFFLILLYANYRHFKEQQKGTSS